MIDSTDHIAGKTGLTPTVTLSKNGGSFAAASGAVAEIGNGWYSLGGNATDRNTLGELGIHATGTGADPYDEKYVIVPWDLFTPQISQYYISGTVVSATSTTVTASGSFSSTSNVYNNSILVMTSGSLLGVSLPIIGYAGSTKVFTLKQSFPGSLTPSANDTFAVLGYHL